MTFDCLGHLRHLIHQSWLLAALISWGIAPVEYLLQVPANRIGSAGGLSLAQLTFTQEMVALTVFVPFAVLYVQQPLKWAYRWATLPLVGAVRFIFRS